jgi:hypothetical protein
MTRIGERELIARTKKGLLWAAVVLVVTACTTDTPKQDMAFVEGCWVLRWNSDQSVSMKTHIAPDKEGQTFRGAVREFGDSDDPGQDGYQFIFARDGSWLEMDNHSPDSVRRLTTAPRPRLIAATLPPELAAQFAGDERRAVFRFEEGDWVVVSRTGSRLGAGLIHADGKPGQTYFSGQQETCE